MGARRSSPGESVTASPFWAVPAWEGRADGRRPVTMWAYEWANPRPDKEIASVRVRGSGAADEEIVLLALTAVK
ncbi:MAG: hypothetical protein ACYC5O_09515 [Anaerolineae bacterium]